MKRERDRTVVVKGDKKFRYRGVSERVFEVSGGVKTTVSRPSRSETFWIVSGVLELNLFS